MGLVDIIKKLLNKKSKVINQSNNKDIISYNTSAISLPKYSKLPKEAKEKVNEYIEEINIEELKTLIEYASELYKDANDITELLLNLSFEINKKTFGLELNKLSEQETLEKRIEALISLEELKEYYKELYRINDECTLRAVALERYRNKEYNCVIEFLVALDAFKKADKLKREKELDSLESAFNELKLCKRRIEYLIETVKKEIGTNIITSISLETCNEYRKLSIGNSSINEEQLTKEILENKLKELLLMINHIKNEKIESIDINNMDSDELIKLIAKYKRKIDLYAYQNKDKINELNSRVLNLLKCQKNLDNKEHFMNLINEIEIMYKIFKSYLKEEHLLNFYELKLDVLCINLDEEELLFKNIKDEQELLYYQKIIELKLDKILNGKNEIFKKEFGENQDKAVGIVRNIIKKENGDFSGGGLLYNTKILAFILAFDKEDGLSEFIKKNYFSKKDLVNELIEIVFIWRNRLPLQTIYQLEDMVGNIDKKYILVSPWVKLLKCSNIIIEKIGDVTSEGEVSLKFPLGIKELIPEPGLVSINSLRIDSYIKGILNILYDANSLKLNNDLERLECNIFRKLEKLITLEIPSTVKNIGDSAFKRCENLEEVVLNEGLESIGVVAFQYCKKLKKVHIPSTVKRIFSGAFSKCENLEEIFLNEGLESIGECAFLWCEKLKILHTPSTLKRIYKGTFSYCTRLEELILNEGLEEIDNFAFSGINLKMVYIPSTVKNIGDSAFDRCENLQEVILNEGLEQIGESSFAGCVNLTSIKIPSTITTIGKCAFFECENLRYVSVPAKNFNGMSTLFDDCLDKQINLQIRGIEIEDRCLKKYLSGNLDKIDIINIMDEEIVVVHYKTRSNKIYKIISEIKLKIEEYKRSKENDSNKFKKLIK